MLLNATKKGIMTSFIMMVFSLILFYILKQPVDNYCQYFIYGVFATGIIWTLTGFQKTVSASAKFKEYFSEGFKTFVVCTLLFVLYTGVFFYFNTAICDEKIELNNKLLLEQGDHTVAEIADNAKQMKKVFIPMMIGMTIFRYLFLGAVITAITTVLFMQKKRK